MTTTSTKKSFRWAVLMAYFGVAAMSQMLWLNLAPLVSFLQEKYQVSEMDVSLLLLSFPLLYVLLSIHSGTMIDRKGYRYVIILGSVISAAFACLRCFDGSFITLVIGQTGIAVGQPYIINGISKLVSDWFDKEENAMATGVGTAGMLIGMALGMGLTPALMDMGFSIVMMIFAAISIVLTLIFILFGKEHQPVTQNTSSVSAMTEIKSLLKIKNLVVLFTLWFFAFGVFNGLTTWLEPILKPNGINAEEAGLVGAALIGGGIIGSLIIPVLSDKYKTRKPFVILCCVAALVIIYPLCTLQNPTLIYVLGGLLGFFFLPGYALLLSMCEEMAGAEKAGAATGVFMMTGNAGAVVVIALMPMINNATNWSNSIYLMLALMVVTIVLVAGYLKESLYTQKQTE
ncbi:MAG: MFS transporter [Bacteroidetes bacterium]|nr:MFS transporter [Bacteroidota bacterium]